MAPLNCDSPIPKDWALALTDRIARYMVSWFQFCINPPALLGQEYHNHGMTLEGLCEMNWMVDWLVSAYRQKERAGTFATNNVEALGQKELSERFADATELAFHAEPSIIVDQSDNIVLWYLPTAVSDPNQKMHLLEELLLNSLNAPDGPWRTNTDLFHPSTIFRGYINMSPAWFQQGHHIRDWLQETREQAAILSGALAIMYPDMYHTGREALANCFYMKLDRQMVIRPLFPTIYIQSSKDRLPARSALRIWHQFKYDHKYTTSSSHELVEDDP
ncbi:hypothetical protein V8E55_011806 [Tylopilus felleus]